MVSLSTPQKFNIIISMVLDSMEDEKLKEIFWNVVLAAFMIFMILLPTFCFKVDPKEYKRLKDKIYE